MNDKVRIFENKMLGGFEVEYDGIAVAQFFYYTEWDERGFMTRDAAKKLATKIARYVVSRGTVCTIEGVSLNQIYFNTDD